MPSFDGPNLVITLDSGVTDVSVQSIYSEWKVWASQDTNIRFQPAFRTIGGDPLSSIINAGAYYFLRNDLGWRIKPPEEDITIFLSGNIALEDVETAAFNPTDGAFTAVVIGLQAITQGVTPQMQEQLEYASFVSGVWVDIANGSAGTDGVLGNAQYPVNNFADARTIQEARGLPPCYFLQGNATLGAGVDLADKSLMGENQLRSLVTILAAAVTDNLEIRSARVTGVLDGGVILRDCIIENVDYINGEIRGCRLNPGTISLGGSDPAFIINCYSGATSTTLPTIDCDGATSDNTPLSVKNYVGRLRLINKSGDADFSVDLESGEVVIDDTVTNGTITVRGDGKVVDDEGAVMLSGTYNGSLTLVNETSYGLHAVHSSSLSDTERGAIADKILGRNLAGGADGGRVVRDALRPNRNRVDVDEVAGTITVYAEDDVTPAWVGTITTADRDAINSVNPA